ncbi:50S ribosomal protein L2 [Candidatus Parcubacteria bacterium]|nr:MAG: 50S ribosomal protein L2 [Candidatus Parcubacteria bacterium]
MVKAKKPTTSGQRQMTTVDYSVLTKGVKPYKPLLKTLKRHAGRNSQGRITVRHQGGGNKRRYRIVDFRQNRFGVPAKVETIEYDPYRTAFIARIQYEDGKRSYILAPHGLKEGMQILTDEKAPLEIGNRMRLKNVPVGLRVYNVELQPGRGGQLARSAGSSVEVLANANGYTDLKLSSGEIRRVSWDCLASIGQVSNRDHGLVTIGKAGRSRWLGIRPTVRGSAMNPVDHPYGGGEGRAQRGTRRPKTKWGKVTGGRKTRDPKKKSSKFILKRRK